VMLSVVVITAREKCGFEALVRSLKSQTYEGPFELVFVDRMHESRAGLYEAAMAEVGIPFVSVADSPTEQGPCPGGARNAGIRAARGDWIVCIDDLTALFPSTLAGHALAREAGFDAAIGSFDVQTDDTIVSGHHADARRSDPRRSDGEWCSRHFYGMHMGFRKDAWEAIGGFDRLFDGVYGQEDCDFGARLWRSGHSLGWMEETKVLCYRGAMHNDTHSVMFKRESEVPTAFVAGVPKWRNDAIIQWSEIVGRIRGDS
jgi:glycosyltransferase involved in cell wall biosynthesis